MWRKLLVAASTVTLAFAILFISVFRTASVKYEFSDVKTFDNHESYVLGDKDVHVEYSLPFPGKVLPDSPLWPIKALRDKVWLFLTTNDSRKAELKLLFADKRLGSAQLLFEKNKPEIGFTTLTKAEKYLEEAVTQEQINRGMELDTTEFLQRLANASLKHYEVMEEILRIAPDDAKPQVVSSQDYSKSAYETVRDALFEKGIQPPESPFDW
jgi:hypothetical protein